MNDQNLSSLQNWNAFWDYHLGAWDGQWTRYQPSGELSESFLSNRSFESDPEKKIINQFNQYFYRHGEHEEKRWTYSFKDHCKKDGFMHPASDYMRGLAFRDGSAAWLVLQAKKEQYFPMELFLTNKNVRCSVGMLYGVDGELQRTACIRERRKDLDDSSWSNTSELVPAWEIRNQWHGITQIIDTDLIRSSINTTFDMKPQMNEEEYFFPDNIVLRCPARITLNQKFTITGIWLESKNQLKTIKAFYGDDSKLIDVRLGIYNHK